MEIFASALVLLVALFHIQVFVMEAILWKTPRARKAFNTTEKTAEITYPLAINQGVYNLFLSAGLLLAFLLDSNSQFQAQIFFLACVFIASVTAGFTASKRIMLIQGLPALLALLAVVLAR